MKHIVTIAGTAGFCFGVRNAIRQAEEAAKTAGTVYTYGPLIHNAQALKDLENTGVFALEEPYRAPEKSTVIIRAHGISEEEEKKLNAQDIRMLDATCPYVKKIHRIVKNESESEKRQIVIFGDEAHPEVKGICGWCKKAPLVYKNREVLEQDMPSDRHLLIVEQTTFDRYRFEEMIRLLEEEGYDLRVRNTICEATMRHQEEAVALAKVSDIMVVLGGKNSSNTKKLVDLCRQHCKETIFAQTRDDIEEEKLRQMLEEILKEDPEKEEIAIGITAGASTPDYVIHQAAEKLGAWI